MHKILVIDVEVHGDKEFYELEYQGYTNQIVLFTYHKPEQALTRLKKIVRELLVTCDMEEALQKAQ